MAKTTLRYVLPTPVARAYIERIGQCMKRGHPYFLEACATHHALLDPVNEINEFLGWIDKDPASPFERHLKNLVHGTTP